jgi:hypothetical protein
MRRDLFGGRMGGPNREMEGQTVSCWYCIPSARPPEEANRVLEKWRAAGYKIALWRDVTGFEVINDRLIVGLYPGYACAVNALVKQVLMIDDACDWIITGGDDTEPDPNHTAEEIAEQCTLHFGYLQSHQPSYPNSDFGPTFGVMQCTGDRFAGGQIDRIAGSPWIGREFCRRALEKGVGPLWPQFTHMFADECLKNVAERLGVYWMRPDLIHLHRHFQRESDALDSNAVPKPVPAHLKEWNTRAHWDEMKAIFQRLKADGFKECLPL